MLLGTGSPERRAIGLTIGALWLVLLGAGFAAVSLAIINTPLALASLALVLVTAGAFIVKGIGTVRSILRLGALPPQTGVERRIGRRFGWIVALEVLGIFIVNALLSVRHIIAPMPAVDLMIVGLHFFPLASIFRVRRYYVTGTLFLVIPALILVTVPIAARINGVQAWLALPSLGCGLVSFATAVASLREARQWLDSVHPLDIQPR